MAHCLLDKVNYKCTDSGILIYDWRNSSKIGFLYLPIKSISWSPVRNTGNSESFLLVLNPPVGGRNTQQSLNSYVPSMDDK